MKIAIFTDAYYPIISGVVTSIINSKHELEKLGHEVYVVTTTTKRENIEEKNVIRLNGINVPSKKFIGYKLIPFSKRHEKSLKKYGFDIIHIHTEFSIGRLGLYISEKYNIPCVYTLHTFYENYIWYLGNFLATTFKNPILWVIKSQTNKICRKVDHVIIPSKKVVTLLEKYKITTPYSIIPSGLDLKRFKKESLDIDKLNSIKSKFDLQNKYIYIYLGRISKEKSLDVVVQEFSKIKDNKKRILLICGFGPELKKIKNIIKNNNLENDCILVGKIENSEIQYYYNIADFFLNASTTETQGLTYVEALASSLCIICKKDESISYVENLQNGILFEKNEELHEKILLIEENKLLIDTIRNNALKSISKFDIDVFGENLQKTYLEVIKNYKK